jgi:hypothetical protein
VALINPLNIWMPDMAHSMLYALGLVASGAYAVFIMREDIHDERDGVHRMYSGRIGFLVAGFLLILGIAWQGYHGSIDQWLLVILLGMVIAKLIAYRYTERVY